MWHALSRSKLISFVQLTISIISSSTFCSLYSLASLATWWGVSHIPFNSIELVLLMNVIHWSNLPILTSWYSSSSKDSSSIVYSKSYMVLRSIFASTVLLRLCLFSFILILLVKLPHWRKKLRKPERPQTIFFMNTPLGLSFWEMQQILASVPSPKQLVKLRLSLFPSIVTYFPFLICLILPVGSHQISHYQISQLLTVQLLKLKARLLSSDMQPENSKRSQPTLFAKSLPVPMGSTPNTILSKFTFSLLASYKIHSMVPSPPQIMILTFAPCSANELAFLSPPDLSASMQRSKRWKQVRLLSC